MFIDNLLNDMCSWRYNMEHDIIYKIKDHIHAQYTYTLKPMNRAYCDGYFQAFYNIGLITPVEQAMLVEWAHEIYKD